MRLKSVHKRYSALVHGVWPSSIKIVKQPLLKNVLKNGERIVSICNTGKISETHFYIQEHFVSSTLVSIVPITGRTHQIRVHSAHVGFPIIFDSRYGNKLLNKKLNNKNKRLCLHAEYITFIHPYTLKKVTFFAPMDNQLKTLIKMLRNNKI